MTTTNSTTLRRHRLAAIATGGLVTALALAGVVPAWTQTSPDPVPTEECTPGMIVDFCRVLTPGRGFLLDNGVYTTLDPTGASLTAPFSINNRGQIVGTYVDAEGPTAGGFTHGFLLEDGVLTPVDVPGPLETELTGIDSSGRITGVYRDGAGIIHGLLLSRKGEFTTFDAPDAAGETALLDLNNRGQIIGGFVDAAASVTHFLLEKNVLTPIEFPGAQRTFPFDINSRGQIVGGYVDAGGVEHGFLLEDGVFTTIDIPGALQTQLLGINNRGQMVGAYQDPTGAPRAVLVDKRGFTTIDPPGAIQATASDINDRGQIIGFFRVPGDVQ